MRQSSKFQKGQIALPVVLLIGGIVIQIAILGASIAYILVSSGYGERLSSEAFAAAYSGIEDAFMRLARNKGFFGSYNLPVGLREASVLVEKDQPSLGRARITSTGQALGRQSKLRAVLSVDSITGEIDFESLVRIP